MASSIHSYIRGISVCKGVLSTGNKLWLIGWSRLRQIGEAIKVLYDVFAFEITFIISDVALHLVDVYRKHYKYILAMLLFNRELYIVCRPLSKNSGAIFVIINTSKYNGEMKEAGNEQ